MIRRFRFTIRMKLLLLSMVVLSVPYLGYEYIRGLEQHLRTGLEQSLTDAARTVAGAMNENYQLFPYVEPESTRSLFIHQLDAPIQIDGYSEDWINYLDWADSYPAPRQQSLGGAGSFYKLILAEDDQYLYVLLQVHDNKIIYHQPTSEQTIDSDYVELVLGDDYQVKERYYFLPSAPGRFNPVQIENIPGEWESREYIRYITNIAAELQPTADGYNLELSIPWPMIQERMGFIVGDVNRQDAGTAIKKTGTAGADTENRPGRVIRPSNRITQIIRHYSGDAGRRIWVLDRQKQVLASVGSLQRELTTHPLNIFYKLLLPSVTSRFEDNFAGASRLQGQEIQAALAGGTESRWRESPDKKAVIVSAATPVWLANQVAGVVMVEETTNNIQILQRNAMVSLINKTLAAFVVVTLALLGFATSLSVRLRRLSHEAAAAVDVQGRVTGTMSVSASGDEIGDLSRNYAAMLARLRQYNLYLESLAGKLSHELRTPMAVVQSSLENLRTEAAGQGEIYLDRAQEGIQRLNLLVTRLSEAARLEQALQSAEQETVDLCSFLKKSVEGYRAAWPAQTFNLSVSSAEIPLRISTDLFSQMLDKIVANAVDFSKPAEPIEIRLEKKADAAELSVINLGPPLPEAMQGELFNSMVSVREKGRQVEPHLGLGLYIARMIVEFHGGRIQAVNLAEKNGVCFKLIFPLLV
jgi:dedicated sortase system histidine kinase